MGSIVASRYLAACHLCRNARLPPVRLWDRARRTTLSRREEQGTCWTCAPSFVYSSVLEEFWGEDGPASCRRETVKT